MRCCICDKPITGTCWFCDACVTEWRLEGPLATWPAWVTELVKIERADRRYRRNFPDAVDDRYPSERGVTYAWSYLLEMGVTPPD